MAGKKVQLPVIGGLRKVVQTTQATPGTTIAEYGSGTITLAQLKAALGITQSSGNHGGSSAGGGGATAYLVPGPGLSGGGALIGAVQLSLSAPIPWISDEGGGGGDGDPGPPGQKGDQGITGAPGPVGPAAFLSADDGEDGWHAIPGNPGPSGVAGNNGAIGAAGPAIYLSEDPIEGDWVPGPPGAAGSSSAPGPFNITPDTHGSGVPSFLENDEFEIGSTIDTAGTRFSGAVPWTWGNQGTSVAALSQGSLAFAAQNNGTVHAVFQVIPGGTWRYRAKLSTTRFSSSAGDLASLSILNSGTGENYLAGFNYASGAGQIYHFTNYTTFGSTIATATPLDWALVDYTEGRYAELEYDGTSIHYRASKSGVDGSFIEWYSGAFPAGFNAIGFVSSTNCTPAMVLVADWFRRMA